MKPRNYAHQLRALRDAEITRRRDYSLTAEAVFNLRAKTIEGMDVPDDQKVKLLAQAESQFVAFMGRPRLANG